MPRDRARRAPLRGAVEFAVLLAALSFILPGRGIGLALAGGAVGFVVGFAAEATFNRRRR